MELQRADPFLDDPRTVALACARDQDFFNRTWFPNMCRQESAPFHQDMQMKLRSHNRYVSFMCFRGSAKTSQLRGYSASMIAHGYSRVIQWVSKTQDHACFAIGWTKAAITKDKESNGTLTAFARFYGLRPGRIWNKEVIEIIRTDGELEISIVIMALGITGQTRGFNIEDYRPDLILVDDPCDEENTGTEDQREKTKKRLFEALDNSLESPVDAPWAKLVLAQTLLHPDDLISNTQKDSQWLCSTYSCFTPDGKSSWEARHPTSYLKKRKQGAIQRLALAGWMREMECKYVRGDRAEFDAKWLKNFILGTQPENMRMYGGIDPVPPPSDAALAKGKVQGDYEAFCVVGRWGQRVYLMESRTNRGHDPSWTIATFWELQLRYRVSMWRVESVAYQNTLKWLLRQSMRAKNYYVTIVDWSVDGKQDRRPKQVRIVDTLKERMFQGLIYVDKEREESLVSAVTLYPDVEFDDELECFSQAVLMAINDDTFIEGEYEEVDGEYLPASTVDHSLTMGHAP